MVTGRALEEAARTLFTFLVPEGEHELRTWLADAGKHGYVKHAGARAVEERFEQRVAEAMEREGLTPQRSTAEASAELYDRMSRVGHNRRSSCVDAVWEPGRTMAYGWSASVIRRAAFASWAGTMTDAALIAVGEALTVLCWPRDLFAERIKPLQKSIEAVRRASPLDESSIREAAGTAALLASQL